MCPETDKPGRPPRGFSLLEALIALLVIAVGLLGVAGMQAASVYRAHVAALNGIAAVEAQNIAALMTANPGAFPPGGGGSFYDTADAAGVGYTTDCTTDFCDSNDMALYDLAHWGAEIAGALPQGAGAVACAGDPPQCRVSVSWRQKRMTPAAGSAGFATRKYEVIVRP